MRKTVIVLLAILWSQAVATTVLAEAPVQTGVGALTIELPATPPGSAVTITAQGKARVRLAGYMRLMICVNGRACGQGVAFWGGGPREMAAKASCAFKLGATPDKVVIRAKSCSARLPDAPNALTSRVVPGADLKQLGLAFRGNMSCAQVIQAAEKFCCEFKKRYKNPNGC